jgi:hypothetical protein
MARKTKLDDDLVQICADNIRLGLTPTACAKAIGITYETWANWCNWGRENKAPIYSSFYMAIQAAEADLMKDCLSKVKLAAEKGDINSVRWLLERRFPADFGKRSDVSITSTNQNLNLEVSSNSAKEEADKIRAEILAKLSRPSYPSLLNATNDVGKDGSWQN